MLRIYKWIIFISIDILKICANVYSIRAMKSESTAAATGPGSRSASSLPEWLKLVRAQVESLKFGTVQITVHDSKVVQVERIEKTRLDRLH